MEGMFNFVPANDVTPDLGGAIESSKTATIYDSMLKLMSQGAQLYKETIGVEKQKEEQRKALYESIKGSEYAAKIRVQLDALGDKSPMEKFNMISTEIATLGEKLNKGEITEYFYKSSTRELLEYQNIFANAAKVELPYTYAKIIMNLGGNADKYTPPVNEDGNPIDGLSTNLREYLKKLARLNYELRILDNYNYTIKAEADLNKLKEELKMLPDQEQVIANEYFYIVANSYNEKYNTIRNDNELFLKTIANILSDYNNQHAITDALKKLKNFESLIKDLPDSDIKNMLQQTFLMAETMINKKIEAKAKETEAEIKRNKIEAQKEQQINQQIAEQLVLEKTINLLTTAIQKGDVNIVYKISQEQPKLVKEFFTNIVNNIYTDESGNVYNFVKNLVYKIRDSNHQGILNLISKKDLSNFIVLDNLVKIYGNDPKAGFKAAYAKFVLDAPSTTEIQTATIKAVKEYKGSPYYEMIKETVEKLMARGVNIETAIRSVTSNLPNKGRVAEIDGVKFYADLNKYDIFYLKETLKQIKDWDDVVITQKGDLLYFSVNGLPLNITKSFSEIKKITNSPEFISKFGAKLINPTSSISIFNTLKSIFPNSVYKRISKEDAKKLLKEKPYLENEAIYKDGNGNYWMKPITKEKEIELRNYYYSKKRIDENVPTITNLFGLMKKSK